MSILTESENTLQLFKEGILKKILKKASKSGTPSDLIKFAKSSNREQLKRTPQATSRRLAANFFTTPEEQAEDVVKTYKRWGMSANKFRDMKDELRSTPAHLRKEKIQGLIHKNLDDNMIHGARSTKPRSTRKKLDIYSSFQDDINRHMSRRVPKKNVPDDYWE
jgi:hypothetical protein